VDLQFTWPYQREDDERKTLSVVKKESRSKRKKAGISHLADHHLDLPDAQVEEEEEVVVAEPVSLTNIETML